MAGTLPPANWPVKRKVCSIRVAKYSQPQLPCKTGRRFKDTWGDFWVPHMAGKPLEDHRCDFVVEHAHALCESILPVFR